MVERGKYKQMPKKVVADIDDIVQIREGFNEWVQFCQQLGWGQEDIAWWLAGVAAKMLEIE